MTHQDWINAIVTFIAALAGGVGGSFVVLLTTKQANRTAREIAAEEQVARAKQVRLQIEQQAERASEDRRAQRILAAEEQADRRQLAEEERELARLEQRASIARGAAAQLLDRLGDLDSVLHMLPRLSELNTVRYSEPVQTQVGIPFANFKRGMRTDLLLVNDQDLVDRYRALGRLANELATATFESDIVLNRATVDTGNYLKWVLISTRQFIDGQPLEPTTAPPVLRRLAADGSTWHPTHTPDDWDLI